MTTLNAMTRTYGYRMPDRRPVCFDEKCRGCKLKLPETYGRFVSPAEYARERSLTTELMDAAIWHVADCKRPYRAACSLMDAETRVQRAALKPLRKRGTHSVVV